MVHFDPLIIRQTLLSRFPSYLHSSHCQLFLITLPLRVRVRENYVVFSLCLQLEKI